MFGEAKDCSKSLSEECSDSSRVSPDVPGAASVMNQDVDPWDPLVRRLEEIKQVAFFSRLIFSTAFKA